MTRRSLLVALLVTAVLVVGWYVALWAPASSRLSSARAAEASAAQTQQVLEGRLASLVATEHELPAEEARLRRSLPALPTALAVNTLIDQIAAAATRSGVSWTNESQSVTTPAATPAPTPTTTTATKSSGAATPSGSTAATSAASNPTAAAGTVPAGAAVLSMTLQVSGSYATLSAFITDLERLPRLLVLDSVQFSTRSSGAGIAAAIDGRAFYDPSPVPALPAGTGHG